MVTNKKKCDDYTTPVGAFTDLKHYKPCELTKIYDPFYHDGKSLHYLQQVFTSCTIIHENKDAFSWLPDCDIVITNPPFSQKNKVLQWLLNLDKPFMVLLPINQMCNKSYQKLKHFSEIQYIVPHGRYNFEIKGQQTSGNWFNCLWYCYKCNLPNSINFACTVQQ